MCSTPFLLERFLTAFHRFDLAVVIITVCFCAYRCDLHIFARIIGYWTPSRWCHLKSWQLDSLLKRFFRLTTKETSKLCIVGPLTGKFPSQRVSNAESISPCHDVIMSWVYSSAHDPVIIAGMIAVERVVRWFDFPDAPGERHAYFMLSFSTKCTYLSNEYWEGA